MESTRPGLSYSPGKAIFSCALLLILYGIGAWFLDLAQPVQEWRLLRAIQAGDIPTVKTLKAAGLFPADGLLPGRPAFNGKSVSLLDYAIVARQKEMVSFLLSEFPVFRASETVFLAWKAAASSLAPEMMQFLHDKGCMLLPASYSELIPFAVSRAHLSPLNTTDLFDLSGRSRECLEILIGSGESASASADSALQAAVEKWDLALVDWLLEKGASIPALEKASGKSVYARAVGIFSLLEKSRRLKVVQFFLDRGVAVVRSPDPANDPLELARQLNAKEPCAEHRQILELLGSASVEVPK